MHFPMTRRIAIIITMTTTAIAPPTPPAITYVLSGRKRLIVTPSSQNLQESLLFSVSEGEGVDVTVDVGANDVETLVL